MTLEPDVSRPESRAAMQLRLAFSQPSRPATLHLTLSGLQVLVTAVRGTQDEAFHYLAAAGVVVSSNETHGIYFSVAQMRQLVNLPEQVTVTAENDLRPLVLLAQHPSAESVPATLATAGRSLRLAWFDGSVNWDEEFLPQMATALLASEVPFIASPAAWDLLSSSSRLPVIAGRATVNPDGYIEIFTSKPQMVEAAPLPALFRIDDSHYGVPAAYADHIDRAGGFVWEGPKPRPERAPMPPHNVGVELSSHARVDLVPLIDALATNRAQAVVWDAGLGRRVVVLAALEVLDAYPLLVVTPPAGVWVWQRHLELFGHSASTAHHRADASIMTYRDLAAGRPLPRVQAVVFDELAGPEAKAAGSALHRLDGLADALRISVDSQWPQDPDRQIQVLSVLRPGEFRDDIPALTRYPTPERLNEHLSLYVSRRNATKSRRSFRRSSVSTLEMSDAQRRAVAEVLQYRGHDPVGALGELLEIAGAGPSQALSPKIPAVADEARSRAQEGSSVVVLCRHRRTATLLKSAIRPVRATVSDAGVASAVKGEVQIVPFDTEMPSALGFDVVLVVDYPWSMAAIDAAVGASSADTGPSQVTVFHLNGSIDDRLALLAAQRRELGSLGGFQPPSPDEVAFLLAPRWS